MISKSQERQTRSGSGGRARLHPRALACGVAALTASWVLGSQGFAHPEIEVQLAHLSAQIERSPDEAELYLQRGHIHRVHRDWKAGMADFVQARELDPDLHLVKRAIGRLLIEAGKPGQALTQLEEFLQHQPDDAEGLILRGRAQAERGAPLVAAADFDAALAKLRRPTPELYIERAEIMLAGGERNQARALVGLDQGIQRLGDLYTLHRYAADLELKSGQPEAALRRARALLEKSSRNLSWRVLEAELLVSLGRLAEARASYDEALATITSLPLHRRRTPAVTEKELSIREALAGLGAAGSAGDESGR